MPRRDTIRKPWGTALWSHQGHGLAIQMGRQTRFQPHSCLPPSSLRISSCYSTILYSKNSDVVEKRKPSYIIGNTVNWYSHYGEQYRNPLKSWKYTRTTIWFRNPTLGHISGENYNSPWPIKYWSYDLYFSPVFIPNSLPIQGCHIPLSRVPHATQ